MDRQPDRTIARGEGMQDVGSSYGYGTDGHTGLQGEVPDADLERTQGTAARVSALGKHQDDATSREDLVDGAQAGLVELTLVW